MQGWIDNVNGPSGLYIAVSIRSVAVCVIEGNSTGNITVIVFICSLPLLPECFGFPSMFCSLPYPIHCISLFFFLFCVYVTSCVAFKVLVGLHFTLLTEPRVMELSLHLTCISYYYHLPFTFVGIIHSDTAVTRKQTAVNQRLRSDRLHFRP